MIIMPEDVPILNRFKEAIDACVEALETVEVRKELTYHYAIVRVYSKMIVTSSAIYTLLINGFPDFWELR